MAAGPREHGSSRTLLCPKKGLCGLFRGHSRPNNEKHHVGLASPSPNPRHRVGPRGRGFLPRSCGRGLSSKSTGSRFAPATCPALRAVSERAARRHPRFIANPWTSGSLAKVRKSDSVLIVGTGLTMVDVVATLESRDHQGSIVAASRRGLVPRGHGRFVDCHHLFEGVRPGTALELLRLVRSEIRKHADALDWQSVIDALRRKPARDMVGFAGLRAHTHGSEVAARLGRSPISDCAAGLRRRQPPNRGRQAKSAASEGSRGRRT